MARARRLTFRLSSKSACVPTSKSVAPVATDASTRRRVCASSPACSTATRRPALLPQPAKVRPCCSASTSVGAMSRLWPPARAMSKTAAKATAVLPLPTSPCNSRCMGVALVRSANTVRMARSWAVVGVKGSAARADVSTASPSTAQRQPVAWRARARSKASPTCTTNKSSKARRCCAGACPAKSSANFSSESEASGWWTWRSDSAIEGKPKPWATRPGSTSGTSPAVRSTAAATSFSTTLPGTFSTTG